MSELQAHQLAAEDRFVLAQAAEKMEQLDFEGKVFKLDDDHPQIQPMLVQTPQGESRVLRVRHSRILDRQTSLEDAYYAVDTYDGPLLMVLKDSIEHENQLLDDGKFEDILPRRQKLAARAANGFSHAEVGLADTTAIHHFFTLMAGAVKQQRALRASAAV